MYIYENFLKNFPFCLKKYIQKIARKLTLKVLTGNKFKIKSATSLTKRDSMKCIKNQSNKHVFFNKLCGLKFSEISILCK